MTCKRFVIQLVAGGVAFEYPMDLMLLPGRLEDFFRPPHCPPMRMPSRQQSHESCQPFGFVAVQARLSDLTESNSSGALRIGDF